MKFSKCKECGGRCCKNLSAFFKSGEGGHSWLLPEEAKSISKLTSKDITTFFVHPVDGETFGRMLRIDGICQFLGQSGCTLGDNRPYDCKMYPYDVLLQKGEYHLIRYTNLCNTCVDGWNDNDEAVRKLAIERAIEYAIDEEEVIPETYVVLEKLF